MKEKTELDQLWFDHLHDEELESLVEAYYSQKFEQAFEETLRKNPREYIKALRSIREKWYSKTS